MENPIWPFPTPDTEFVRCFGSIRTRKRGGIEGWVGENVICEASNALRFNKKIKYTSRNSDYSLLLKCAFKRLYFDGKAVGKYEVGIHPPTNTASILTKEQCREFIEYCLALPVSVRSYRGSAHNCPLIYSGKHLARLYTNATTKNGCGGSRSSHDWWVQSGQPLLFLELDEKDDIKIPFWSRPLAVSEKHDFRLFHCLVPYGGSYFRMWILIKSADQIWSNHYGYCYKYITSRALRISLMRLHAEHECLRLTLRNILNENIIFEPRSKRSDKLQAYLNDATRNISRIETNTSSKNFDTEITEIARRSFDTINVGQRDNLLKSIEELDFRKNVFRKLEKYIEQWSQSKEVTINVNNGDTYNAQNVGAMGRSASSDNNTFIQSGQNQTLAEAAAEIQMLLEQLSKSYKITEVPEQAVKQIEQNPQMKDRMMGALKNGGKTALEKLVKHPAISIVLAAIDGASNP